MPVDSRNAHLRALEFGQPLESDSKPAYRGISNLAIDGRE
jgi:hypothetical protein